MGFVPKIETETVLDKPLYSHGYTDVQVIEIKEKYKELLSKIEKTNYKPTLEETKFIVIPYIRIHRTEEFILNEKPEKIKKEKVVKEKVVKPPKEPKIKKLTKKQIGEKIQEYVFKLSRGENLTEEEDLFLKEHTKQGHLA